ncbi:MAG: lipid A biosynthesis acyltransferase [Bacteroidetes bacterium]|nr:MAG: lipid A biosynthesis acyltransferase [Bacteroidota bacterium]
MATWQGKTRGGVAGYLTFIFILKYLGLNFAYFILRFVVVYFVLFAPLARKSLWFYFRKIHGWGFWKSFIGLFRNFYIFGQTLLDKVALLSGVTTKFTFDFDGEEHLRKMALEGNGGMLIGAHLGNWEIAGQLLDRLETRVNIVMLDAEHQAIKKLLDAVIQKREVNIIPIKPNSFEHLFAIKEALFNNELVVIHGDRYIPENKTVTKLFMGREADFPLGPFQLATKYNKPVTFVTAVKETKRHYHFMATSPKVYSNKPGPQRKQQLTLIMSDYISWLEDKVAKYPYQWFNYYYFWKLLK